MKDFDFVALSCETANHDMFTACRLGMIGVKDGRVRDTFSTYIRPPGSYIHKVDFEFTPVHGISYEDVKYEL
jgi:DNA polymerase III epsilon subunit-like protein